MNPFQEMGGFRGVKVPSLYLLISKIFYIKNKMENSLLIHFKIAGCSKGEIEGKIFFIINQRKANSSLHFNET